MSLDNSCSLVTYTSLMASKVILFFHLLLLCCPMISMALANLNIKTDQYALLALKSGVFDPSGLLAKNWTTRVPVCNWSGVKCSSRHHRVVALSISDLGLRGSIPPEIGNLSFLSSITLANNSFRGNLPQEMGYLRRLKYVSLSFNDFTGGIPSWLGSLPNLQLLLLANNSFTGTLPLSIFNASKLERINVNFNQLEGSIPQEIGKLGNLKMLDMQGNHLTGSVPLAIFNISSLQVIAITGNSLTGNLPENICSKLPNLQGAYLALNRLSGPLQSRFGNCSVLQILSLSENNFSGPIPRDFGNITTLYQLAIAYIQFQGEIPPEIGNLLNLEGIGIEESALTGPIPKEIGNLQKLIRLGLTDNRLSGPIPATIFNMSSLGEISLSQNYLSGSLPHSIAQALPNLEVLYLGANGLSGNIPDSISNLTKLTGLDLGNNHFTGSIPSSLGNLRFLEILILHNNSLTSGTTPDMSFLTSITKCRSLRLFSMAANPVKGTLPGAIANFSNSLEQFDARLCEIEGNIPAEIGNLSGLIELSLGGNYLNGTLPTTFKKLQSIQGLDLQGNMILGSIPDYFCNFKDLTVLDLSENKFSGQIPECFGNMTSLRNLYLHSNGLNTTIPASLWGLKDLLSLDVRSNSFGGSIPLEIGNLKAALFIDLSSNKFSGNIPTSIGGLQNLINISLADNELEGSIPENLGNTLSLESLDLSQNNLTGEIPTSLVLLIHLKYFNVSFNRLHGKVPANGSFLNFTIESFMSNEALCGGPPHLRFPACPVSRKKRIPRVVYILLPTALTAFAAISIVLVLLITRRRTKNRAQTDPLSLRAIERISYYDLVQATNGFGESNLIASGSYSSVYKGVLRDGTDLAIKVFNLQLEGAFKTYDAECEVLRKIRHRNLVKVISTCSNDDFKALVLEYMPNGSLQRWLYSHNYFIDFLQRLNIMIDVATALDYLHHGYSSPIIHCDLKPNNVLLDQDMTGHVGDFGIAKLLGGGESMAITKTLATIGYIAPEYGFEGKVSTSCDVYSFGILLMETFSRKRPTDDMFTEDCGLKDWVRDWLQNPEIDLVDQNLITSEDKNSARMVQCISKIMELALTCTAESSEERIDIKDALNELKKIKVQFLSK